jgi:hypothetical protein
MDALTFDKVYTILIFCTRYYIFPLPLALSSPSQRLFRAGGRKGRGNLFVILSLIKE